MKRYNQEAIKEDMNDYMSANIQADSDVPYDEDDFIYDDDMGEELSDYEEGYSDGYEAGYSDAIDHSSYSDDYYESVGMKEATDEDKAMDSIKWLIDNDWGKSNDIEGQASERFKALSFNDSDISNKFLDEINKFTSGLKDKYLK